MRAKSPLTFFSFLVGIAGSLLIIALIGVAGMPGQESGPAVPAPAVPAPAPAAPAPPTGESSPEFGS